MLRPPAHFVESRYEMVFDIVLTTFSRIDTLKKTLRYIWDRTSTPYRLTVIDDCTRIDGTQEYLKKLLAAGKLHAIHLRPKRTGIRHYLEQHLQLTTSDPLISVDDDILCPKLKPDWLYQGLQVMKHHPELGVVALNNPYENWSNRRPWKKPVGKYLTYIHAVGGTFAFIRREILRDCVGSDKPVLNKSPMLTLSQRVWAHPKGFKVGYLSEVYCQHNQGMSTRTRRDSTKRLSRVLPMNPNSLEPAEKFRR